MLNGSQLHKEYENEKQFIFVPNFNEESKLLIFLEDQLQVFLCDIIAHFAWEINRLK